jgi:serine/threonine protein phosphatase PrpC
VTDDLFCEVDGSRLVVEAAAAVTVPASELASDLTPTPVLAPPVRAGEPCTACGQGTIEPDGYCSACGRRAASPAGPGPSRASRPTPSVIPVGARLAGGTVVSSRASDEHVVRAPDGASLLVVVGDAVAIEREAEVLRRLGGGGGPRGVAAPRVLASDVDPRHGAFVALSLPDGPRPLADTAPALGCAWAIAALRALLDVAQSVERLGFAWDLHRDDVSTLADGTAYLGRVRVPRKLGLGERLDARAIVEALGGALVPAPAIDGPPRLSRLLLPHIALRGDAGNTLDDVRGELAAVERELQPPGDGGTGVAGVCDPGLARPHNEDAFAVASGTTQGERWTVLVVCDGVSSSSHAEQASAIAAKTACDALAHFARTGDVAVEAGAAAVTTAIRAAHVAVCAQGIESSGEDPPGTTIVAGLVWKRRLTVGWVGDSRAYWVSPHGSELLTRDHSWAMEAMASGQVTEAEAMQSPLAHALTRCLGPLEVTDPGDPTAEARRRIEEVQPDVRTRDLPEPGWIILCSDGFWNYFSPAAEVSALVRAADAAGAGGTAPARVARRLVNAALARGGQDNTTVVVYEYR